MSGARVPACSSMRGRSGTPVGSHPGRIGCAILLVLACLASTVAAGAKPRVPIGTDPGGMAIAIIGSGADYARPEIARRLARDGEGELVGWDFRDMDRAPYEPPVNGASGPGTAAASALVAEAASTRLVLLAPKLDAVSLGQAAYFVLRSPVRIALVTVSSANGDDWRHYAEAVRRAPHILFVVAAGDDGADLDASPRYPASLGLDNALVVTASDAGGQPAATANTGAKAVDIAAPAVSGSMPGSISAATRIAALAARLAATEPALAGAALKARILDLAGRSPATSGVRTRSGWIADPSRP